MGFVFRPEAKRTTYQRRVRLIQERALQTKRSPDYICTVMILGGEADRSLECRP